MKNRITLTITSALSLFAVGSLMAQDVFAGARTILALPPQVITAVVSNVVDVHGYDGVAKIDLISATRDAANVTTFTLAGSATRTGTYATIATFALGVPTTVPLTNTASGGATNYIYYAGTVTTPTAATAGWATPYLVPSAFTTSGASASTTSSTKTAASKAASAEASQSETTAACAEAACRKCAAVVLSSKKIVPFMRRNITPVIIPYNKRRHISTNYQIP